MCFFDTGTINADIMGLRGEQLHLSTSQYPGLSLWVKGSFYHARKNPRASVFRAKLSEGR